MFSLENKAKIGLLFLTVALLVAGFLYLKPYKNKVSVLDPYENHLFYSPTCPYCKMALNYANKHNIEVYKEDVSTKRGYEDYKAVCSAYGGSCGVPLYVLNRSVYLGASDVIRAMSSKLIH